MGLTAAHIYRSRQTVPVRYSTSSSKLRKKAALTASEPDILAAVENEETSKPVESHVKATGTVRMERVPSSGMYNWLFDKDIKNFHETSIFVRVLSFFA